MAVKFQVPFMNGNQVHHVNSWQINNPNFNCQLKDSYEFSDILYIDSYSQGRSRVTVKLWSITTNHSFECTLKELFSMLKNGTINQFTHMNGQKYVSVTGTFGFKKVGTTVSLYLITE